MPTVHLWYAAPVASASLVHLLDEVERTRLSRLRQVRDQDAFATGRVLARQLGAELGGIPVGEIGIDSTCPRCGKPHGKAGYAAFPTGVPAPSLSISHTSGLVAVAASDPGLQVGVDLEPLLGSIDLLASADTFLSPLELDALRVRPAPERPLALLRTWVRKEAALKATGDGLLLDPALLTMGSPDEPAELLAWEASDPAPEVMVVDVEVDPAYLACLAVVGDQPVTVAAARREVSL